MPDTKVNQEWIKITIQVIVYIVVIVLAYGMLDKRVTVLETVQERKVDGEELQKQLKEWKNEIIVEVKEAIRSGNN